MIDPVRVGELFPGVLAEVVDRAGHGHARWAEQVAATGYCTHPVRLRGRVEQPQLGRCHAPLKPRRSAHDTAMAAQPSQATSTSEGQRI